MGKNYLLVRADLLARTSWLSADKPSVLVAQINFAACRVQPAPSRARATCVRRVGARTKEGHDSPELVRCCAHWALLLPFDRHVKWRAHARKDERTSTKMDGHTDRLIAREHLVVCVCARAPALPLGQPFWPLVFGSLILAFCARPAARNKRHFLAGSEGGG